MKWNTRVSNICTKANRTIGFLRRNLAACPKDVKESAYKGLSRPVLEYGGSVWDPQSILLQDELEKVQKRAARYKGLSRLVLEYGGSVWDPQSILLQDELEKVQKRAARFVTGNYTYETGSLTGILEQLK